jgi:hypothetical protein
VPLWCLYRDAIVSAILVTFNVFGLHQAFQFCTFPGNQQLSRRTIQAGMLKLSNSTTQFRDLPAQA